MDGHWHRLCPAREIVPGQIARHELPGLAVAVCRTPERLVAFEDRCPHAETRLSDGTQRGCRIRCPLHGAVFDLHDGRLLRGPAAGGLRILPVRITGETLEVWLPTAAASEAETP